MEYQYYRKDLQTGDVEKVSKEYAKGSLDAYYWNVKAMLGRMEEEGASFKTSFFVYYCLPKEVS